jgi:glycosyltransferase involved in cell wall biosynthesis
VRPEQKAKELDLADVVLVPSSFVQTTVREHFPNKAISIAPYGVNSDFWAPASERKPNRALTFICAGQICVRKGSPDLLQAWSIADLKDAELHLVGSWNLADERLKALPRNVKWYPPCSAEALRERYRGADVFVFPSYFEGLSLVLLEALACGLPTIASTASGMADLFSGAEGFLLDPGDLDALVSALRWAEANRDQLDKMGAAARRRAELCSWDSYRTRVQDAVRHYL